MIPKRNKITQKQHHERKIDVLGRLSRNQDILVLPADKENTTVVMNQKENDQKNSENIGKRQL